MFYSTMSVKNRLIFLILFLVPVLSCHFLPMSDKQSTFLDAEKLFYLKLNPDNGSNYVYNFTNTSIVLTKVNEKEIESTNKLTIDVDYSISKDSAGSFLLAMKYNNVIIYTKNQDAENTIDMATAGLTGNPVENVLQMLKGANIVAEVKPNGEVMYVKGYKELAETILNSLGEGSANDRRIVQAQLEQTVERGMIKSGLEQLFKLFPDSAIHVNDRWKLEKSQDDQIGLKSKASFKLKEVEDSVAYIVSEGGILSDGTPLNLAGQAVKANLKGTQHGSYQINRFTGMLIESEVTADVEGDIEVMGKIIPISIKSTLKARGIRIK